ncbi:MAG: dihydroxy-acid dehydratase [Paracoccaceae bacterium]|nr:MAG: dihydroxy-acid dehydratase [Paracoccaceae bacterium]
MRKGLAGYGDAGFSLFLRKAFIKAMGYSDDALDRPIIGITNTFSGYNACHRNVPDMIEALKRGVMLAGGLPIEFPVISMHEAFSHPTSMYLRNLMAMDVEEMVRAQPMDAVVLIGGCDKTVPALLMGAASADVPAILTVTGPMITGSHKGERLGACTDCRRLWGQHRAGTIEAAEIEEISAKLAPGPGTCMVMGTASTMALVAEAMGMMLPGGAAIPAVHADRMRHAEATGARAVAMAAEGLRPTQIMTRASMRNALRVLQAVGGSTNGVVHLAAIAGRLGFDLDLEELDRLGAETPVLVDLKPSGQHYMEDLFRAGGLVTVLREIGDLIDRQCLTVTGRTLGEDIDAQPPSWPQDAVRPMSDPIHSGGGIRLLRGNLAPNGAIIKQAAATPSLLRHTGRAVVFTSLADMAARLDDPALDVTADDILVLQNAGPKGAPGMPEAGYIPIPKKLAVAGVRDMVRISDARMSGTAFGAIVLHVSPEAATGGPLGLVRDGDMIALDVGAGSISLLVDDAELLARRAAWSPPAHVNVARGYAKLYFDEVLQAEDGCDFNFLRARPRESGMRGE